MNDYENTLTLNIEANTERYKQDMAEAAAIGRRFGSTLSRAFEAVIIKGRSLGDVLRSVAQSLASSALRAGLKPLENMISGAFGSLFGSMVGGASTGKVLPFADGGVVNSPVLFPLGHGQSGVMGEAGAEAILPLARGSDGRLGVRAAEGQGAGGMVFNFQVNAQDAESFRRSESQITAMIARAAQRGTRNL